MTNFTNDTGTGIVIADGFATPSGPIGGGTMPILEPVTATASSTGAPTMVLGAINQIVGNNFFNSYVNAPPAIFGHQFVTVMPQYNYGTFLHPFGSDTVSGAPGDASISYPSITTYYCLQTGNWSVAPVTYYP